MDSYLKELSNDHRNDLLITAADGFDVSLLIVGQDVVINGNVKKVILENKSKVVGNEKTIAAPLGEISLGDIVSYKNQNWLIDEMPVENEVYAKASLKLCNANFPIKTDKTSILKGHNEFGKPIYEDSYAVNKLEPCIVERGGFSVDGKQILVPSGTLNITLKYQPSDTLAINYEFTMYNSQYKIMDIDFTKVMNEKGVIKIIAERE